MSQVYDACMFHSENDMLELRIATLYDVVDRFIVVESRQTHSGHDKPLNFDEDRFYPYKDKIVYAVVDQLEGDHSWAREHYHRGYISNVLRDLARPDDWVIVGDCDEIPSVDAIEQVKQYHLHFAWEAAVLELDFFYYDFAHKVEQGWGIGMCLWRVQQDANKIRQAEFGGVRTLTVHNAGIHASYFMTPDQVVTKLNDFMHFNDIAANVPRDPAWLKAKMDAGVDIFERGLVIEHTSDETLLPKYVLEHREKYEQLGWLERQSVIQT